MAELVGGAFLSATLQVAFERLASRDVTDYFRGRKIKNRLLKKLQFTLISINQVLEDAEEMQYRNQNVKQWLDELKDAVFKAEDLLDEIATEALQQKLKAELHPTTSKVRNFLTTFVNPFDKEIESRIQVLLDHLDFLEKQKDILGLKQGSCSGSEGGVGRKLSKRLPTTSLVEESKIYGRNDDKEEIIRILLSHDMSDNRLPENVISITGMGGMGKTTLAQLVYNDKRVIDQFHLHAWVCISEEFNVVQLTKTILQAFHCSTKDSDDFNQYQLQLKEKLTGKKFFLVLDDVWNENRTNWDVFQSPLNYGASGSKIFATTRNKKVASVMHSTHIHHLKPLEDEYCWNLFAKHAFNYQQSGIDPNLISVGKKIVKKCGGLPLAIKTLGSLLYTELSVQKWVNILESEIWLLSEDDSNIIPALRLSYHYLPSNLKRCFAYCSIFPKNYDIEKNFLIRLWMAEGLLHFCQKDQSIEEIGNEYFNDLESRSFFEPVRRSGCYFIMHDLLNDLANSVMGEFCRCLESDMDIPTKARYISYLAKGYRTDKTSESISKCNQLRSFVFLNQPNSDCVSSYLNCEMEPDLLSRLACFKHMRVLSLRAFVNVKKLANICNLQHLRYLDLSHTQIKELPDSICSMIYLQTLKLKGCHRLVKLPSNFYKLINLRHLDLEDAGIRKMPKYVGKLENLQKMTQFVVGKHRGSDMRELGKLNHLKDSLVISKMENIIDPSSAREANVSDKKYLNKIEFDWGMIQDFDVSQSQRQELVLEFLQPHSNLKELTVRGYAGTRFSNWFDGPYLPNLISLHMWKCKSCINLPPFGQLPFLEELHVDGFDGIKVIGQEFYGNGSSSAPFRSLLYLHLTFMEQWEEWNICYDGESFPRLRRLHIWDCPKLTKSLPQHLPSLKELSIDGCENLETSLPKAFAMEVLWLSMCKKISLKDMPAYSLTDMGSSRSGVDESSLLPPLRYLTLIDCPEMESLPQADLLSRLRKLSIHGCPKVIASRKDWGLHELLSLEDFVVGDDLENVESFPEEELLPTNIRSLVFDNCPNLKTINYRGLLLLQSLESLSILDCPALSFEGLPEEGLPKSLSYLEIQGNCPLLQQSYQRNGGQDWPKISHIQIPGTFM